MGTVLRWPAPVSAVTPMLTVRHLSKRFGGARALDDASLTVLPAEVHGLLGENGSGKSTLIKILNGFHLPEPGGEVEIHGKPVQLPLAPGEFRQHGLAFVHQDLGLMPSLTVLENLRIGEMAANSSWFLSRSRERSQAREAFARFNVDLDPDARVADLLPVDRALLAIVRATEELGVYQQETGGKGLFVLDEPTVFLPAGTMERLYALVREIAAQGSSVLFVSHDLAEVLELTDRLTVLRDGRVQGTVVTAEASQAQIVEMILGHALTGSEAGSSAAAAKRVTASVQGVSGRLVHDVSFRIHEGEVLGLAGLMGSGIEELPYLVIGGAQATAGRLRLAEEEFDLRRMQPHRAVGLGIVLIPANRQRDGSIPTLTVADNVLMPVLRNYVRYGTLQTGEMRQDVAALLARFDVRPSDPTLNFSALSGGNQQKALLAKWLQARPRLLLLDKPTQGVDVGAREQLFALVREFAAMGTAVLVSETDYEALEMMCHRVLIFGHGSIVTELVGTDIKKQRITRECYAMQ